MGRQYYIRTQAGVIYELDSTTEISLSLSGKTTDFPLESGESVSDHYINQNNTISFSGTITDIKTVEMFLDPSGQPWYKSTDEYINGLRDIKKAGEPFSIHFFNKIEPLDNCVFENLTIEQNQSRGSSGDVNSYRISFTAKQVKFARQTVLTSVAAPSSSDLVAGKSSSVSNVEQPETAPPSAMERIRQIREQREGLRGGQGE